MWQNTDNNNSNDSIVTENDTTAASKTKSQNNTDSIISYNDNESLKTNINNEVVRTQQAETIQSDYCCSNDYNKRKFEYIDQVVDNRVTKRGRGGRGSRGSYRPRGRARYIGANSISNSYGATSNLPRVCINPEILKILGYTNQSNPDYYYANNSRITPNNYGMQVLVDPQTGLQQTVMNHEMRQQTSNYMDAGKTSDVLQGMSNDSIYRNDVDKLYYYQYENSNETQEFITEDKLNSNFTELTQSINNSNNSDTQTSYVESANSEKNDERKSILDISRANQHQLNVEWDAYNKQRNSENGNYENYTPEAAKFMNEIEILFQNDNNNQYSSPTEVDSSSDAFVNKSKSDPKKEEESEVKSESRKDSTQDEENDDIYILENFCTDKKSQSSIKQFPSKNKDKK